MYGTNTPTTFLWAHLVRLYKMLLCFALGPKVSEILKKNEKMFSLASLPIRTLRKKIDLGSTCRYSGNKEEWHLGSAEARFLSWKVALSRTRRIFLQTVVLPFCIHATIPTNTRLPTDCPRNNRYRMCAKEWTMHNMGRTMCVVWTSSKIFKTKDFAPIQGQNSKQVCKKSIDHKKFQQMILQSIRRPDPDKEHTSKV